VVAIFSFSFFFFFFPFGSHHPHFESCPHLRVARQPRPRRLERVRRLASDVAPRKCGARRLDPAQPVSRRNNAKVGRRKGRRMS
jgi:hypothetical protein